MSDAEDVSPICSAKGCREVAAWVLSWNNPKLHTPDRRKTWTACADHRVYLTEFLETRGFLRETLSVQEYGGRPAPSSG
ncbi:MAG: hypothetical protein QOE19_2898 [Actinomycetota bacterium]|nr:hypothetical protein [Actinomycetota bacterium]MDQ1666186.1 hypothetical protein [Actinomycetota bacterium]MDQ1671007.1 hypothetical protein [Actinomycetota bacterium]